VVLHTRKAFSSRFHEGLTALDVDAKGKAAAESRALFLWVAEKVGLIDSKQATKIERQQASKVA
jgi:hypothetical protein